MDNECKTHMVNMKTASLAWQRKLTGGKLLEAPFRLPNSGLVSWTAFHSQFQSTFSQPFKEKCI